MPFCEGPDCVSVTKASMGTHTMHGASSFIVIAPILPA